MRVLIACSKYPSKIWHVCSRRRRATFQISPQLMLKIRKVFREEMMRGVIHYVHTVLDMWSFYEHDKNIRF